MNGEGGDALELALALRAAPAHARMLRSRELPTAMATLLELAAGRRETVDACARRTGESPRVLVEAAILFIQQVLFDERSDHYRVLGVRADAPVETIHEHHRWLMRWLHPDRAGDRWETVYSDRVNAAWNVLRSPERRQHYDAERAVDTRKPALRLRVVARRGDEASAQAPALSSGAVRRLPIVVLGSLLFVGIIAVLVMADSSSDRRTVLPADSSLASSRHHDVAGEAARRALGEDEDDVSLPSGAAIVADVLARDGQASDRDEDSRVLDSTAPTPAAVAASAPVAATPDGAVATIDSGQASRTMAAAALPASMPAPVATNDVRSPPQATALRISPPLSPTRIPHSDSAPAPLPVTATAAAPGRHAVTGAAASAGAARVRPTAVPDEGAVATAARARAPVVAIEPRQGDGKGPRPTLPATDAPRDPPLSPGVAAAAPHRVDVVERNAPTVDESAHAAARSLPRDFAAAYARGDHAALMRLFAPDARENRDGRAVIAENYRRLFAQTSARALDLAALTWTIEPERIVGQGAFTVRLRTLGQGAEKSVQGWIRIEARPIGGDWKIARLLHGNDQ
ncbi:MAG: DnaJ domain-containing protein [Proteobacteria bacterium]|nr:DnaJ domain-containing protein [Pseudomonadota bacterium]